MTIDPNKIQKRRFVRLEVVRPVKYRRYTGNPVFQTNFNVGRTINFNVGRTINLSVGGVKLSVSTPIPVGTKLDMEIELSDSIKPYVVGKVIGGEEKVIDGISRRIEKISFLEVDKDAQDLMTKYIFNRLRKVVRKDK
jgi:c-di-GMP-binding flagellar brake protein YcgR